MSLNTIIICQIGQDFERLCITATSTLACGIAGVGAEQCIFARCLGEGHKEKEPRPLEGELCRSNGCSRRLSGTHSLARMLSLPEFALGGCSGAVAWP